LVNSFSTSCIVPRSEQSDGEYFLLRRALVTHLSGALRHERCCKILQNSVNAEVISLINIDKQGNIVVICSHEALSNNCVLPKNFMMPRKCFL